MPTTISFYLDDSGTRRPNKEPLTYNPTSNDFFALGGVLVDEEAEAAARAAHASFCAEWKIDYPLHSVEIRHRSGRFSWLNQDADQREQFMVALSRFLTGVDAVGVACVIDRPGYDARYFPTYNRRPWHLCQTAFCIAVERAAKYARERGARLRVYPERCSKADDARLRGYYNQLRSIGCPFDGDNSERYAPLDPAQFSDTLYEIAFKAKSSPMAQLADLYLWPMAKGGYRPAYRPYSILRDAGKLIDSRVPPDEVPFRGIKYSCFELVTAAAAA